MELKDALTVKFKHRFGHGATRAPDEMSVASAAIREEVDRFAATADITEGNLGRLERRLQSKARGGDVDQMSEYSAAAPSVARSASVASFAGSQMLKSGAPKSYDWAKLDEYAAYLHEQDCIRQQLGVKALQKKLRSDLDQQVALKQQRRAMEQAEDQQYHQNSMVELERWKEMEHLREEEKHQKIMREKMDRDAQLAFERKLKAEELARKRTEESSLVEKIVAEMETEQKKFEKKKEQTRKAMRKVFEDNAVNQAKRNEEQKEMMAREAAAMKEYARAMDEQEEQRALEMQQRMQKQKELMAKLQANVDGIKKGAGDNDAARALAQQEEMDHHFFEAERVKQNRLRQLRLENQAYLLRQMEEKDARKDEDKMLQNIQAQILQRDTEEYNDVERQKVLDRRSRLVEHSKDIKKQMAYKLSQSHPQMSEAEIQLNKPLLDLVHRTLGARPDEQAFGAEE